MLKEKDLRGFEKGLKGYESQKLFRAGFSIRAPSHNIWEACSRLGLPSFHAWCGSSGPPVVIPAYFKIVQFGTDMQWAPRVNCPDRRSDIEM
jgi:hypothetical protein